MQQQDDWQDALAHLESQLAFQEETIRALNEALASQQADILLLQRQLKLLKERQDEQAASLAELPGTADERPPHY